MSGKAPGTTDEAKPRGRDAGASSAGPRIPWSSGARGPSSFGASDRQAASAVLMIRPKHFGANAETAASNRFQTPAEGMRASAVARAARAELDGLASALERAGIDVHVVDGWDAPVCPDEVFPNNWLSTHADGTLVLYPMLARNRRLERREDIASLLGERGYAVHRIVDLTELEARGLYLEGTGSLVLDRVARVAFACVSARTTPEAVGIFGERMGYDTVTFRAEDRDGHPVYHTNVMMSVGTEFAVVCTDAIREERDRRRVLDALAANGKKVISLSYPQLHAFAGNLLELRGERGAVIALSTRGFGSLEPAQRALLAEHGALATASIDTIETLGGGSVRCMLAEVHLPRAS